MREFPCCSLVYFSIPRVCINKAVYSCLLSMLYPYYSAQYICPLEKKWDFSLGHRDISPDHRNKTIFILLYYSHSRPLREARGNHSPLPEPLDDPCEATAYDIAASNLPLPVSSCRHPPAHIWSSPPPPSFPPPLTLPPSLRSTSQVDTTPLQCKRSAGGKIVEDATMTALPPPGVRCRPQLPAPSAALTCALAVALRGDATTTAARGRASWWM